MTTSKVSRTDILHQLYNHNQHDEYEIHISGRWKQSDLKKWITFNRVVKNVDYNEHEDNFKVVVKNTVEDRVMAAETFDMVFVASGMMTYF